MKRVLFALALMTASAAFAADAPTLTVTKSIDIKAPANVVWDLVKNFDGLNKWHPAVAKDQILEGKNNTVGAVRLLTLSDGGTIKEKLLAYDDAKHTMKYSILEGVLPVSSYESTISVEGSTTASKVTWSGTFKRKDLSATPAKDADDATAKTTMEAVYQAGLDNLAKLAEAE
jgi:mxaD protein